MICKSSIHLMLILTIAGCSSINTTSGTGNIKSSNNQQNTEKTTSLYKQFIEGESPNIAQLNLFFSKMPKGGDLHHHYSGSIYVETYLDWVEAAGYCIDKKDLRINYNKLFNIEKQKRICEIDAKKPEEKKKYYSVNDLRHSDEAYRKLLTLWSDKDYHNHYHLQPPPDTSFFNTFNYFGSISGYSFSEGLMILKNRAIKENVSYIETMLTSVDYNYIKDKDFNKEIKSTKKDSIILALLDDFAEKILADKQFDITIKKYIEKVRKDHKGLDDDDFMIRYQTYASRGSLPSKVFSALYAAFMAAEQSELIVGVNIVGPENGIVALDNYHLHMLMFAYLKNKFPSVNRALHAGELTLGMVRPKDLKFHIAQAVNIAGAQRIGHGIDLPYEEDAIGLLNSIKDLSVIEINFTSNEFILGVKGNEHPYLIYSAYGVPMVISTDDSGVSRNNLTNEYVLLSSRYKPGYRLIKEYVYNSLKYSFLSNADKKRLTSSLDKKFNLFEQEMADYYDTLAP